MIRTAPVDAFDVVGPYIEWAKTTPIDGVHGNVTRQIAELGLAYNLPAPFLAHMRDAAVPNNPTFKGEGTGAWVRLGCDNQGFTCGVAKVTFVYDAGKFTRGYGQVAPIPWFIKEWASVNRLTSAGMSIALVRARVGRRFKFYLGLAPKRVQLGGKYWKGGGGFLSNRPPGSEAGFRRCIPVCWPELAERLNPLAPFHAPALAELKEEIVGGLRPVFVVATDMFFQESCHSGEIYGALVAGYELPDGRSIESVQGEEPDVDQGKTYWFTLDTDVRTLSEALIRFGSELGTSKATSQFLAPDIQTGWAIIRAGTVLGRYEQRPDLLAEGGGDIWTTLRHLHSPTV